jgi:alpha-ketoglutarate-dependent 2,4-dichlorophenoxyacetate dioxygenase
MSLSIFPLTPEFAAEIGDVDLSRPLPPDVQGEIKAAFWEYAVLVFPDRYPRTDSARFTSPRTPAA